MDGCGLAYSRPQRSTNMNTPHLILSDGDLQNAVDEHDTHMLFNFVNALGTFQSALNLARQDGVELSQEFVTKTLREVNKEWDDYLTSESADTMQSILVQVEEDLALLEQATEAEQSDD
jgi:hypothetical protein